MADIRIDAPGIYEISNREYHADPCAAPSLPAGIAKILVKQSPAHAWTNHPRCPWFKDEQKQQWDLGGAAHAILLEGEKDIVVIRADSYRTDAAKAARDLAYARGQTPVLPPQLEEAREFVGAIRAQLNIHETDADAFSDGKPELSFVWQEPNGVWCRCRPDWTPNDPKRFYDDFKSTATSVNPDTIGRWAMDQGHDLTEAFYRRGIKALTGREPKYRFVAAENSPPYGLCVYTLPKEVMAAADEQVEYAIRMWGRCLESGTWPSYPRRRIEIDAPPWATALWEMRRERVKFESGRVVDPLLAEIVERGFAPPPTQQRDDLDRLIDGEF